MLLRHTPNEITERTALSINPAKTCQPIGAMYAALGIHNCLPHSHGSQGCCAYHRSALTRHYQGAGDGGDEFLHRRRLRVRGAGQPAPGHQQHLHRV